MSNHEFCVDCGLNDYHQGRPCRPADVAEHLGVSVVEAATKRQCQPLAVQPIYREPEPTLNETKSLGQCNYEGYFEACGGLSLISGHLLPPWDKQDPKIQAAWEAAAQAVIIHTQEVSKP